MSYLLGEYQDNIIRVDRRYRCLIPAMPEVMTVTYVSDTEVHFTRKGVSGISMMAIDKFCEIAVPIRGPKDLFTRPIKKYRT